VRRLAIVVEGPTEQEFVEAVLRPHFIARNAHVDVTRVGKTKGRLASGGGHFKHWLPEIRWVLTSTSRDLFVSTLFDLYGLPPDFPRRDELSSVRDTSERCTRLEQALASVVNDTRFVPYIQRHEFEALVLAALPGLRAQLDASDTAGVDSLIAELGDTAPEDVNDDPTTAPSKRLERCIEGYTKTLHGPLAILEVGLPKIRRACPRFDAWLSSLETRVSS